MLPNCKLLGGFKQLRLFALHLGSASCVLDGKNTYSKPPTNSSVAWVCLNPLVNHHFLTKSTVWGAYTVVRQAHTAILSPFRRFKLCSIAMFLGDPTFNSHATCQSQVYPTCLITNCIQILVFITIKHHLLGDGNISKLPPSW